MPIYEYECDTCNAVTEAMQKISDSPLRECPNCKRGTLERILSAHSVGGTADGFAAANCAEPMDAGCGSCGKAGTGCS